MMKLKGIWLVVVIVALSACVQTTSADYGQYLAKNQGAVTYPKIADFVRYHQDSATDNHRLEVRSFMAGLLNKWVLRFGQVLDATIDGKDFRSGFTEVEKVDSPAPRSGWFLKFSLIKYRFEDKKAFVSLRISAYDDGRMVVSKIYQASGVAQTGKMFWAGAFGMKNAVQQSTKGAMDQIFRQFFRDLK